MNNISIEELEEKIDAGEEVIDRYFDSTTTRVGTPRQITSRKRQDIVTTNLEIPNPMLNELDKMATELNISRQAVIKMMLRRALDEHYLTKNQMKSDLR
jgi:ABC-type oligopeptide transport system ATPase subunit